MATLINDKDIALQASPYRNKTTLVNVTSTVSNFTVAKNGGPVSPASTVLTATPNLVFTAAAVYSWDYSLNTSPTSWKGFVGGLIPGTTTFSKSSSSVSVNGTGSYTNLIPTTLTGIGTGAVFNISKGVTGTNYNNINIEVTNGGTGYQPGDQIKIAGTSLGYVPGTLLSTTTIGKSGTAVTAAINKTGITGTTNGAGTGATFTIVKASGQLNYNNATITVTNGGSGYAQGNTIIIPGSSLGTGHGDLTLTITGSPSSVTANDLILTVQGQVFSLVGPTQTITNATIKGIIGSNSASSITFRCTVTEPLLDTAYGQVVVAYTQEQANSDSINIELSKLASTISLSVSGAGSYSGTGTTLTVTRSGNSLAYDVNGGSSVATATANSFKVEIVEDSAVDLTVPLRTIGTYSNTTNSFIFNGITALTADYATVTFRVIVYDASGNKTQTTYKQIQYSRVASGVQGADAVVYFIDSTAPVLIKSSASIYEIGEFVQITINGKRTIGGVTSNYGYITITGNGDVENSTATDVSSSGITTNILNSSSKDKYTVKLYNGANTATALLLDTQTIPVVFTGGNAIIGSLSNDNVTIPLAPGNLVPTGGYDNTTTFIRVFESTNELTYRTGTSTTVNASWVITNITATTGITKGTITTVANTKYVSQSKILSMDNINTGTLQFDIAGLSGSGKAFTLTLVQTINKGQPGSDALISYLEIPTPIISKSSESITTDGVFSSIIITGKYIAGTAAPINAGYITASPKVKVTDFKSDSKVYCTGVSAFTVNDPIVFSGINLPTNITAGTEYFIKTIDSINKAVTISASIGGTAISWTNGQLAALTNGLVQGGTGVALSGTSLTATFTAKTGVTQKATSGSGTGAVFTVTKTGTGTSYSGTTTITITSSGKNYAIGNTITIDGAALGGISGTNDLIISLNGVASAQKLELTQAYGYSEKTVATALSLTTNIPNDAGIYSLTVKMYSTLNRYTANLLDSQEVLVLYKGANAVSAILTNDSVSIPFNTALNGTISAATGAYDGSGTIIRVFEGTVELIYDGIGTSAGTYTVAASGSNITAGNTSGSGVYAIFGAASTLTSATATITYTITGKTTGGSAISLTKIQAFSRNASGQPGAAGMTYKVNILTAYAWTGTGSPPTINGTFNYNWTTGALANASGTQTTGTDIGYPTGWTKEAGSSTANNQTLYQLTLTITAPSTDTTTNGIAWSNAKTGRMGYRQDGSIGWTGDSARIAYTKKTLTSGNTVATEAAPAAPVGNSLPITSGGYTWTAAPPTLVAGEIMYQSDGFYAASSGNITWGAPYLSSFKVGQLSAITADLGYINAGAMSIGPSSTDKRFIVTSEGAVTIRGAPGTAYMQITNDAIKVYDGGLRLQLGNLDA